MRSNQGRISSKHKIYLNMATIKVKYRPSTMDGKEGSVYFQIIHNRVPRHIPTDYHIYQDEWDDKRQTVITSSDSKRKSLIQQIRDRLRWDLDRLNRIIHSLGSKATDYTADDVVEEFKRCSKEYSLIFMENLITKLKQNNRVGTADNYQATLNSVKKFIAS